MATQDRKDFGDIKAAILSASFEPAVRHGFNPNDYDQGVLCAKLPQPFDDIGLLDIIDRYTSGNSGAIVGHGPSCGNDNKEQWLILSPEAAGELKANLRSNTPKKFGSKEEMDEALRNGRGGR